MMMQKASVTAVTSSFFFIDMLDRCTNPELYNAIYLFFCVVQELFINHLCAYEFNEQYIISSVTIFSSISIIVH